MLFESEPPAGICFGEMPAGVVRHDGTAWLRIVYNTLAPILAASQVDDALTAERLSSATNVLAPPPQHPSSATAESDGRGGKRARLLTLNSGDVGGSSGDGGGGGEGGDIQLVGMPHSLPQALAVPCIPTACPSLHGSFDPALPDYGVAMARQTLAQTGASLTASEDTLTGMDAMQAMVDWSCKSQASRDAEANGAVPPTTAPTTAGFELTSRAVTVHALPSSSLPHHPFESAELDSFLGRVPASPSSTSSLSASSASRNDAGLTSGSPSSIPSDPLDSLSAASERPAPSTGLPAALPTGAADHVDPGLSLPAGPPVLPMEWDLTVGGTLYAQGETLKLAGSSQWTVLSDARLKDVLGTFDVGGVDLMQLQPRLFRYKPHLGLGGMEADGTSKVYVGLLAQEGEALGSRTPNATKVPLFLATPLFSRPCCAPSACPCKDPPLTFPLSRCPYGGSFPSAVAQCPSGSRPSAVGRSACGSVTLRGGTPRGWRSAKSSS